VTPDPRNAANYTSYKINVPVEVDGNLDKAVWQKAAKSPRFVDMVTGDPGLYNTRAAVLWDDENLYVGFWAEEPFVTATLTERDSLMFLDNDLELFIDGGDCYYELEVNAFNTLYEVFFIWKDAYKRNGKFDVPEFDVFKEKALTFGGDHDRSGKHFWWGTHPRKLRWAFLDFDMPGLRTAVQVDGRINDPSSIDKGWTLEIAIPWKSMNWLANGRTLPPSEGDVWKMFFGRFQKITLSGKEVQPHPAWAWNKHGIYDTHLPECFTNIHFTQKVL
jgi:hypothetical protein